MKEEKQQYEGNADLEYFPWQRRWHGGMGYHAWGNRTGGANGKSKHDRQLELENSYRAAKKIRANVKSGK